MSFANSLFAATPFAADGASGPADHPVAVTSSGTSHVGIVAGWIKSLTDSADGTDAVPVSLLVANMLDQAIAAARPSSSQGMSSAVTDNGGASTALLVAFSVLATTAANASDSPVSTYGQITQLVDTLLAADLAQSVQAAKNVIIEAATARDSLLRTFPVSLTDSSVGGDLAASLLKANIVAVDAALATTTVGCTANITFALQDNAAAEDTPATQLDAYNLLVDGARAVVTLLLNGNVFTGVVLNAETAGVSEYTNFPFNSFAFFNGKYYGGADDGGYELAGDTDNGTPVTASVRTGLIRMSDGLRTQVPYAYFGLTTSGDMLIKVITTSPQGAKNAQWYKFEKRAAGASRETRVKIGRGLSSVYWQFELVNITGADFAFDSVQLMPIALERRV